MLNARPCSIAALEAADAVGLRWENLADRPEAEVYSLLFPGRGEYGSVYAPQPHFATVHREVARVGGGP